MVLFIHLMYMYQARQISVHQLGSLRLGELPLTVLENIIGGFTWLGKWKLSIIYSSLAILCQ